MKFSQLAFAIVSVSVLLSTGCGGGGGGEGDPVAVNALVPIDWPERTRVVMGPGSALSAKLKFHSPVTTLADSEVDLSRNASQSAHIETYSTSQKLRPGMYVLSGKFYADANQNGDVVGDFSADVAVQPNGTLTNPDGSPLGVIAFNHVVTSVKVVSGQTLVLKKPTQLVATAYDVSSQPLVLTPGSFHFTVVSGATGLATTPDGMATATTGGAATVAATVDGVTSPATNVAVNSNIAFWSTNGHYYEVVPSGLGWAASRNAAAARTFAGLQGHLATLTSQSENEFLISSADVHLMWIGGFQAPGSIEPAGGWGWVTGEPFTYTNWSSIQPDNNGAGFGNENCLILDSEPTRTWGDLPDNGGFAALRGYVVEYEP